MRNLLVYTDVELYLALAMATLYIILIIYDLVIYARPLRMFTKLDMGRQREDEQPPVSIILYTRDEADNLRKHLPALLNQSYPQYEVVVVNDGSTDETEDILKIFSAQYKHLYSTYVPSNTKNLSRRKLALTLGNKAAKYDLLLFTEVDCQPTSANWLACMARNYTPETSIVLGFCKYGNYKGFFHKLVAYDNLLTGLRYLSAALLHRPYMGNGQNLSYRKELFFKNKGFCKSLNLLAGDDDLFINETATKRNTHVEYSPDSLVEMDKIERFNTWKMKIVSRTATQKFYKGHMKTVFRIESACYFLFHAVASVAIVVGILNNWILSLLAGFLMLLRLIVKVIILKKSARMLDQAPCIAWLPLVEVSMLLFKVYIFIYRLFEGRRDYTFRI